jgi:hypothetical protein
MRLLPARYRLPVNLTGASEAVAGVVQAHDPGVGRREDGAIAPACRPAVDNGDDSVAGVIRGDVVGRNARLG